MIKEKKELEYPDAPSGFVTLYNYKEPFMPFSFEGEGYGYEGVLLFDGTTDKIQCHLCGGWYKAMGNHLHREHNMLASAYKEIVGLRQTTALVSESLRAKMIANGLDKRLQNLRAGGKKTEKQKKKISETLKRVVREKENETGTCPMQLLDRLKALSDKLGRCPTNRECGFEASIVRVYGSFSEACKLIGLIPRKSGQTLGNKRYITKEQTIDFVKNFWINNSKMPRFKNFTKKSMWKMYRKIKREIDTTVLHGQGIYNTKNIQETIKYKYSKDYLLEQLVNFKKINDRLPAISDCKRGLLPNHQAYYYYFGNFKNAVQQI